MTRSPLAREDFDLYRSLGRRLVFGISLPTLRNDLARIYEPKAPAPTQLLATLHEAKAAGLHGYVALAARHLSGVRRRGPPGDPGSGWRIGTELDN